MEERKSVKISLSTVLLLVAILVIVFIVYYIYTKKTNYNKQIADLETNIANMQYTIDNLQEKIDNISNTINNNSSTLDSNADTDKSLFLTGTYTNKNTKLTFDETKFNIYLDEGISLNGFYEIVDNKIVVCNISEYTFNGPECVEKYAIDKNEKWSISFNIKNEKSLEVKEINLPDSEVEIIITIFNLIEIGDNFLF